METTRADLADKLSALESQVTGTVQAATDAVETTKEAVTGTVEAVSNTVETVKDTVQDTVEAVTDKVSETIGSVTEQFQETVKSVAETFNVKLQCERHPWAVFGGAVAVGALGGFLLGGSKSAAGPSRSRDGFPAGYRSGGESQAETSPPRAEQRSGGSVAGSVASAAGSALGGVAGSVGSALGGVFGEQLSHLKGLAIGAMMGVVRDLAARSLPDNIKGRVTEEVDKITRSLGGEPIQGSILPEPKSTDADASSGHQGGTPTTPANYGGVGGRQGHPATSSRY